MGRSSSELTIPSSRQREVGIEELTLSALLPCEGELAEGLRGYNL